jgi:hypothetical protein
MGALGTGTVQRIKRAMVSHGMSGLFRKVSRRAKMTGLCGWVARIRTSKCRFLEAHGKGFELTEDFLAGLERLRSRPLLHFLARTAQFRTHRHSVPRLQRIEYAWALKFGNQSAIPSF